MPLTLMIEKKHTSAATFYRTGNAQNNSVWWNSKNMYANTTARDGVTLTPGFTSLPWINYTDISNNSPDMSLNGVNGTSSLSLMNVIT